MKYGFVSIIEALLGATLLINELDIKKLES